MLWDGVGTFLVRSQGFRQGSGSGLVWGEVGFGVPAGAGLEIGLGQMPGRGWQVWGPGFLLRLASNRSTSASALHPVTDACGEILFASDGLVSLLGWPSHGLEGRNLSVLMSPDTGKVHVEYMCRSVFVRWRERYPTVFSYNSSGWELHPNQ